MQETVEKLRIVINAIEKSVKSITHQAQYERTISEIKEILRRYHAGENIN